MIKKTLKASLRGACITLLLHLAITTAFSQTHTPKTVNISGEIQGYWEYLPVDYATSTKKYPLLIFIHGAGECGDGSSTDLQKILDNAVPKLIKDGTFPPTFTVGAENFSFIVISPQFTSINHSADGLTALLSYTKANYRIDTTRIYVSGLSMGGGKSLVFASSSETIANQIAAVVTACAAPGSGNATAFNTLAKANVPVWMTSNQTDPTVPLDLHSQKWYDGMLACTPQMNPLPILEVFNVTGHDAWSKTYDLNHRLNGLNIYEWMLQYKRGSAVVTNVYPEIAANDTITLPVNSLTLNGSGSTTNNGAVISTYLWKVTAGNAGYSLTNANTAQATLSNLSAGTYTVQLTVTNDKGVSASVSKNIVVESAPIITHPVVVFSTPKLKDAVSMALNAENSYSDQGASISKWSWSYVSGPKNYTCLDTTKSELIVSYMEVGTYTFKVQVIDNMNGSATGQISFTMNADGSLTSPAIPQGPKASIKGAYDITLPVDHLTLDAITSVDNYCHITDYSWSCISGPSGYTFSNPTGNVTSFSGLKSGDYSVRLYIKNSNKVTACDTVSFTVHSATTGISIISGGTDAALKLYPVPVSEDLNISMVNQFEGKVTITICDINGRLVLSQDDITKDTANWIGKINVRNLASGLYFIEISVGQKRFVERFIKN